MTSLALLCPEFVRHFSPVRTSIGEGNMCDFDSERFIESVLKKSFLYDVKDEKHSNRSIVQKGWEYISKVRGCESYGHLHIIYSVTTVLLV
jgi:hypothetical protein